MFNIYRVLLLALKKVEMVKFTYSQIHTTQYNKKNQENFTSPQIPTKQYNRKTQQNVLSLILGDFSQ